MGRVIDWLGDFGNRNHSCRVAIGSQTCKKGESCPRNEQESLRFVHRQERRSGLSLYCLGHRWDCKARLTEGVLWTQTWDATRGITETPQRSVYCSQYAPGGSLSKKSLIDIQPDDIDGQDIAMCLRWQIIQTELEKKSRAPCVWPLSTPKHQAWQPPPTYTFAGGSAKRNEKLWRSCMNRIEAAIARETDQQSRDNMEACLEWVRSHGYPLPGYFMVWAACGIATCTTRGEFSRFWAAHGKISDRISVYALGVTHVDGTVVDWRYGLATADLGTPPPRVGYEETWPEHFVMTEWLDQISWEHVEVRRGLSHIPIAPGPMEIPRFCADQYTLMAPPI